MKMLPLAMSTLYADLLQQMQTATEPPGSVFTQDVRGITYLKAHLVVAGHRRTVHLGRADEPGAAVRATAITEEMNRAKDRRRIVSTLRAAGFGATTDTMGRIADAVAAAGLFKAGMVLVGTGAYQCYPALVGATLPLASMMTQDADLATATLALVADARAEPEDAVATRSLEAILHDADPSFTALPHLNRTALPCRFRNAAGFVVDLLVPRLRRQDPDPMPIPRLGAAGMPLQHLGWLLEQPVPAAMLHGTGVLVTLPRPQRYAVHKLIISQKRHEASGPKRQKDLAQAEALIEVLRERDPFALADALADAMERGANGWREPILRSLRELRLDPAPLLAP